MGSEMCIRDRGEAVAIEVCINECQTALDGGRNLSDGPCLIDPIENIGWVCDVAHRPRQEIDDMPENQCSSWIAAYNEGRRMHFVEVSPECDFIRAS